MNDTPILDEAARLLAAYKSVEHTDDDEARARLRQELLACAGRLPDQLPDELAESFYRVFVRLPGAIQAERPAHFAHLLRAYGTASSPRRCYELGVAWANGEMVPIQGLDSSPAAYEAMRARRERATSLSYLAEDLATAQERALELCEDEALVTYAVQEVSSDKFPSAYLGGKLILLAVAATDDAIRCLGGLFDATQKPADHGPPFVRDDAVIGLLEALARALRFSSHPALASLHAGVVAYRDGLADGSVSRAAPPAAPPPSARKAYEVERFGDEAFWALISTATRDWDHFEAELSELSAPRLAGFSAMFWALSQAFFQWAVDAGFSEDAAEDAGGRLVARGPGFYRKAIQDPEGVVTEELLEALEGPGMDIMYEALKRYEETTGERFPAFAGDHYDFEDWEHAALASEALV